MIPKRILAVIPARGGSKSIPKKNIVDVCGKPLIQYTISESLKVEEITDLVVSTDDNEIANIATGLGALVPFLRPAELATDAALTAPAVKSCLLSMEQLRGYSYDYILLLQPTSPLRRVKHIKEAINALYQHNSDSVVSVCSVEGNHPFRMKRVVDSRLINFIEQGFEDMRPRQALPPVYIRNGAIYLCQRNHLVDHESLVGQNPYALVMPSSESVNIDTPLDLELARILIKDQSIL